MIPLSVLDLSPIVEGSNASVSLRNSLELVQLTEKLGFHRYWLAEHHSSAPSRPYIPAELTWAWVGRQVPIPALAARCGVTSLLMLISFRRMWWS